MKRIVIPSQSTSSSSAATTVLLSRRYQTGWHDGEYSVPAGHVEAGETVTQAALREAREEVGLELSRPISGWST